MKSLLFFLLLSTSVIAQEETAWNIETKTWISDCSAMPTMRTATAINILINAQINDGTFPLLDRECILGVDAATSAAVSLVNPSATKISAVNTPTFTAYQGYLGDGSTSYLDLGIDMSSDVVQYTQASGAMGFWINNTPTSGSLDMGCTNSFTIRSYVISNFSALGQVHLNGGGPDLTGAIMNVKGFCSGYTLSGTTYLLFNGSVDASGARTTTGLVPLNCYLLAINGFGVGAANTYSMYYIGSGAIDQIIIYTDVKNLSNLLQW